MNIKKILVGAAASVVMFGTMVVPAFAAAPNWDVSGEWVFDYNDGNVNLHDMTLSQTAGVLTGSGGAYSGTPPPYKYPWTIKSGSVDGDTINFTADYTATVTCFFTAIGKIAPDGTMSGTWTDNCAGARNGIWATKKGIAKTFPPKKMDQCKKDGWKIFNNPSFKNQGQCVSYVEKNKNDDKKCTKEWNVTGSYNVNVKWEGTNYPEILVLTQSGTDITGKSLDTIPSASPFIVTGGTVIGNIVNIYADNGSPNYHVHMEGIIAENGIMSGTWHDEAPGTRIGTWSTTLGKAVLEKCEEKDKDKDKDKDKKNEEEGRGNNNREEGRKK